MRMNRLTLASVVVSAGLLMSACGGSSSSSTPVPVVASDTKVTINATTGPAVIGSLLNTPATFPNGVAAFGTTKSTAVTFKGTPAAPTFEITTADGTAKGNLSFGSCKFTVTENSNVGSLNLLAVGTTITIDPCSVSLGTKGKLANGIAQSGQIIFTFASGDSVAVTLIYAINANGTITINGSTYGTATLTTGA